MNLFPMGDYYVWYCDRCDSRNQTLWTRIESGLLTCAACHMEIPLTGSVDGRRNARANEPVRRQVHV